MQFNRHKSWDVHNKSNKSKKSKVEEESKKAEELEATSKERDLEYNMEEAQRMLKSNFQKRVSDEALSILYEPPPGITKEDEEAPEDCIPDKPENQAAREFLKIAPTKGLWMPLGKEVKVMQCWRCKAYGHRTGDRECPLRMAGNILLDADRQVG